MSQDHVEQIEELDLFRGISLSKLTRFMELARDTKLQEGHVILKEGESSRGLFYIVEGSVDVLRDEESPIHIDTLHEGECFGEMSLFTDQDVSATVVTSEMSKFMHFPEEKVFNFFDDNPEFTVDLLMNLVDRLCIRLQDTTDSFIKLRNTKTPIDQETLENSTENLDMDVL